MLIVLFINYIEVYVKTLGDVSVHKVKKIRFVNRHRAMLMLITIFDGENDVLILEQKKGEKLFYTHSHPSFLEEKAVITFPDNKLYLGLGVLEKLDDNDNKTWECEDPNNNNPHYFDLSAFREEQQKTENFKKSLEKKQQIAK